MQVATRDVQRPIGVYGADAQVRTTPLSDAQKRRDDKRSDSRTISTGWRNGDKAD
jgi:hypothetical protein